MTDFVDLGFRSDSRDLRTSKRDLDALGKSGTTTGTAITGLAATSKKGFGAVAIAASAALAAMASLGAAIQTIQEFDRSMSKLGAITGATALELTAMRDIAKDLGSSTEFSAKQAADGLTFLGMAGFTASESMASIASVLDLATASGMGLAQAADTASNIMSGFGIAAENSANVADVLAAASSRANTDVGQLGQAMSTVAPIASALGIDLADTAASIGVLSDAGIQGARAGTAMRGVLASLAGPTDQAEQALARLGVSVKDVDPATNDLSVVMGRLKDAGLSTADAMTIFGREAASGALVLVEGSQRLGEFGDELRNVDGAASDMAATMRDNLGGDIDGLRSAVSGLMLALGDAGLTAVLRLVTQGVTATIRGFSLLIDAMAGIPAAIGSLIGMQDLMSTATDNVTLAMGDEITQANTLFALMGNGNTMTQSAALAKLSQAEAHLRTADALRQEKEETIGLQQAQLAIDYQRQLDVLSTIREGTDGYYEREEALVSILNRQSELKDILDATNGSLVDAQGEVDRIREAIANSTDGMVTFNGETLTAAELTDRIASSAAGVNFDSATLSASYLTQELGLSLSLARQIEALGGRGVSGPDGAVQQTRASSNINDLLGSGMATRTTYAPTAKVSTRGGGSSRGGSGGGVSEAQREAERERNKNMRDAETILNSLMTPMDEYNDALDQANRLMDAGVLPMGAYTQHINVLKQEFNDAAWQDSGFAEVTDQLIDAALSADSLGDAFEGMKGVALNAIKEIVAEMAKSSIMEMFGFGGGIGGGSGGGLGGLLGGLLSFDGGGFTGNGSRTGGVDGKGGFPAMLHPNETVVDHTKGQSMGGVTNIQLSLSPDLEARILQQAQGQSIQIAKQGNAQMRKEVPGIVQSHTRNYG